MRMRSIKRKCERARKRRPEPLSIEEFMAASDYGFPGWVHPAEREAVTRAYFELKAEREDKEKVQPWQTLKVMPKNAEKK